MVLCENCILAIYAKTINFTKKSLLTKRTLVGKGMVHFDEIDFVFGTGVVDDYICGAKSLYLYYFYFFRAIYLEWVPLSPLRPLWSEKLHMDQGSGHIPIDRGT